MLNSREADRRFLKACRDGNSDALGRWHAESYWMAVAGKIHETLVAGQRGRVDLRIVRELAIVCTDLIYDLHERLPHRFFSLKFIIRRRAKRYAKSYLREGGKLRIDE